MAKPAAFGRLCVETNSATMYATKTTPAAFGRLCVETNVQEREMPFKRTQPPSGGCVLKLPYLGGSKH